ncbi:acyl-CoA thioesterase [Propionicimonas sp.]|uniref:acyl-CoA thioesterase n=1 Tax=Propionicimonas sp. TaxID=1955623 RepID=UPI001820DA76|nr:acyl-CoA thioesterase [Propionicimonas sp.]MBU3976389.1 acyl-CoA thioesterase [Actinomycetota bacterium]MBA3022018.1 acyl-CoA thioesterase [Propionicimonas sp.]MBU3987546.1 acyl-CoA thioesterase [Actinomycetota bacterium]MBU4006509.1 acyl-CoA thioesterase [Actinomycetota bacterium]MBU4065114.1 acyl-CoA thioesterase [Actinomycetota bacterium]
MESEDPVKREPRGMLVLRTLAMPADTNPWGDVFGGWLLAQMDIAAGLMAGEVAMGRSATVSVNGVVFRRPVAVGQTICIYAELIKVGRTSMEIQLEVWARDLVHRYAAEHEFVTEGVFYYVAVDQDGHPRTIEDNPPFFTRADPPRAPEPTAVP